MPEQNALKWLKKLHTIALFYHFPLFHLRIDAAFKGIQSNQQKDGENMFFFFLGEKAIADNSHSLFMIYKCAD